jgi:hypothetical protein
LDHGCQERDWPDGHPFPADNTRKPSGFKRRTETAPYRLLLPDFYPLINQIAKVLIREWMTPPERWDDEDSDERGIPSWLSHWAHRQAAWAITKRVHEQWKRLLADADPTILTIQNKVFSASFGYDLGPQRERVILQEELYREKFLVKDLLTFRAAGIVAAWVTSVAEMAEWRKCFCPPEVRPYTALNKTLNALPGGVPPYLLARLHRFILPRPITNRLELITTILADGKNNFSVFAFAHQHEIAQAMQKVGRFLHRDLSHRRRRDVKAVVQFLSDFPERHPGRIVGLADKAIRWHRDCQDEIIQNSISRIGNDTLLAKPPIPLPDLPGVKFLATVGDVCEEAELMKHCIASYIRRASNGQCYLFHVDHDNEAASVEVSAEGYVMQSQGPGNKPNRCSAWATKLLSPWAKRLRNGPGAGHFQGE